MTKKRKTKKQKIKTQEKREGGMLEYSLPVATTDAGSPLPQTAKVVAPTRTTEVAVAHLELIKSDLVKTVTLAGLIIGLELALYYLNMQYGWLSSLGIW